MNTVAAAGTIEIAAGLTVNRMAYGAMRIVGPGTFGPPEDHGECIRTLRRAVELGVDFIDTADSYGPYVSEELIAEALYPYPSNLVIGTKAGFDRPAPGKWVTNGRPEHLRAGLEGSLKRLRLERIDLWQLHRIDTKVPEAEQFDVVADFIREGLVRNVGLSEVSVDQITRAQKVFPVVSVQNQYSVINRRWDDVVNHCEHEDMVFIPWAPLGGSSDAITKDASAVRDAVNRVAQRHGVTDRQIGLAWLLARSPAMLVIPGTGKVAHLEENIAAAAIKLTDDDLAELG